MLITFPLLFATATASQPGAPAQYSSAEAFQVSELLHPAPMVSSAGRPQTAQSLLNGSSHFVAIDHATHDQEGALCLDDFERAKSAPSSQDVQALKFHTSDRAASAACGYQPIRSFADREAWSAPRESQPEVPVKHSFGNNSTENILIAQPRAAIADFPANGQQQTTQASTTVQHDQWMSGLVPQSINSALRVNSQQRRVEDDVSDLESVGALSTASVYSHTNYDWLAGRNAQRLQKLEEIETHLMSQAEDRTQHSDIIDSLLESYLQGEGTERSLASIAQTPGARQAKVSLDLSSSRLTHPSDKFARYAAKHIPVTVPEAAGSELSTASDDERSLQYSEPMSSVSSTADESSNAKLRPSGSSEVMTSMQLGPQVLVSPTSSAFVAPHPYQLPTTLMVPAWPPMTSFSQPMMPQIAAPYQFGMPTGPLSAAFAVPQPLRAAAHATKARATQSDKHVTSPNKTKKKPTHNKGRKAPPPQTHRHFGAGISLDKRHSRGYDVGTTLEDSSDRGQPTTRSMQGTSQWISSNALK